MARIYYSLYDRMVRAGALYKGFQKVRSAGGAAGVDGQSIEDFAEDLEQNLATLAKELREKCPSGNCQGTDVHPEVREELGGRHGSEQVF